MMNSKRRRLACGLALGLLAMGVHLHSQELEPIPKPKPAEASKDETEESVLNEKAEALEGQYNRLVAAEKVGAPFATPHGVRLAGCDWHLASAELAAVRGQGQEQIRHLEQAVEFIEEVVAIQLKRQEFGAGGEVTQAIVRRADVKLALIRAKKQQNRR